MGHTKFLLSQGRNLHIPPRVSIGIMMWLLLTLMLDVNAVVAGKNWAVLIAGSNGWGNYRHQSDVCHAFHILHDIGNIPSEQIYVMMADDIAHNEENPFPGNIINYPNGPNVYPGVNKNVTGEDVTAKNFLKALYDLPSTRHDNVFIYFTDHGAKGLVAMPFGDPLYADQLNDALKEMHKRRKYNKMVIYIEACESGSMFDNILDDDLNIYATTASDDDHSSYAYYFDEKRGVYLADLYSINWMQDSQYNMTSGETLLSQYELVKLLTNESTVEEFGDLSMQAEPVENFQASGFFTPELTEGRSERRRPESRKSLDELTSLMKNSKKKHGRKTSKKPKEGNLWQKLLNIAIANDSPIMNIENVVDSRDVTLATLMNRMRIANYKGEVEEGKSYAKKIGKEFEYRQNVDTAVQDIITQIVTSDNRWPQESTALAYWFDMTRDLVRRDYDCLRLMVRQYQDNCYRGLEDYSMKYVRVFANLCTVFDLQDKQVKAIMKGSC